MAKKKARYTQEIENMSNMERLVIERMNKTLEASGMNKSTYAANLGWALSRLSKILSLEQRVSLSDSSDMAQALGYPLDAFIQPEFDLEKYEQTHDFEVYTIRKCIDDALSWTNDLDRFKECMLRQFPRTLKKVLGIQGDEFVVEGEINENKSTFIKAEGGFGSGVFYKPQITVRYKGVTSKNIDFLSMGYWIDEGRNYLALAICYVPDKETFSTYGVNKRNYYKSLIEFEQPDTFDVEQYDFSDSLKAGEIYSKVYDFSSSRMDEETLISDLTQMFELYKKLVAEVAQAVDVTYWQIYNDIVSESGQQAIVTHDDFAVEVRKLVRSGPRNPEATKIAMERAGGKCECCRTEQTFLDSKGRQYFEGHHLIPLAFREQGFEYDIPENIICLCPNCHSMLHHANDEVREKMVVELYYGRKEALAKCKIEVSLARLLKMYKL